jgi:hypothetical protein
MGAQPRSCQSINQTPICDRCAVSAGRPGSADVLLAGPRISRATRLGLINTSLTRSPGRRKSRPAGFLAVQIVQILIRQIAATRP